MPDDLIVNEKISAILGLNYRFLIYRIADYEGVIPEDRPLICQKPVEIITNTSIELFQVIGGVKLYDGEVV